MRCAHRSGLPLTGSLKPDLVQLGGPPAAETQADSLRSGYGSHYRFRVVLGAAGFLSTG